MALIAGASFGAVMVATPAGAHVASWEHNWTEHIRPRTDARYYTKTQANQRYYTKTQADQRYYTKTQANQRYYTKAEVYSKAELDNRTVRMSINPHNMVGVFGDAVFNVINGCVTVDSSTFGGSVYLPLEMPIGARLLNVDFGMYDGNTATVYNAYLYEMSASADGLDPDLRGIESGGSDPRVFGGLVEHEMTVEAGTTVDDGDSFMIQFDGIDDGDNGVCYATIEYDPAP